MGFYFRHPASLAHDTGTHPENAGRLGAVEARLSEEGFLGLEVEEAPAATAEQIERVHPSAHRQMVEALAADGGGRIDADTVVSADSYRAALHAAGAGIEAVDRALEDGERFSFCGMRPPGHHAEADRAMGFCLFNNVAVAAAHAREAHEVERVAIVDWDVHHGNGTQAIFYASEAVLYISVHQSPLYPGTGAASETGVGAGDGYTLNLPVPAGTGGAEFRELIDTRVGPAVLSYDPGLLLVSAGFDAHRADPLAECELESEDYLAMASSLRGVAGGLGIPVVACLEGGYALEALAESVSATIRGFTAA